MVLSIDDKSYPAGLSGEEFRFWKRRGSDVHSCSMSIDEAINRAFALFADGRLEEAAIEARRVLGEDPARPQAHRVLAGVAFREGRLDEAEAAARRAWEIDSTVPEAAANLAAILVARGEAAEAEALANQAVALAPDFASAWINLGLAQKQLARFHDAVVSLRRAVELQESNHGAWTNLGNVLCEVGEYEEAAACCRQALQRQPRSAEAVNNLGNALLKLGRPAAAIESYQRALREEPGMIEAEFNLGTALEHAGRLSEAEAVQRNVLARDETNYRAANNLGVVLKLQGRLEEAATMFAGSRQSGSGSSAAATNQLATMLCQAGHTPPEILEAHRRCALEQWGDVLRDSSRPQSRPQRSAGPLRVGFVSPDLGRHPVGWFLLGGFEALDRERVQPVCFSDRVQIDMFTERFRSGSETWRDIRGRDDETVATWIRDERIDVLVDLAGHTGHHRLGVFARRPSPLQLSWIGYPSTTGLVAIDGLIADDVLVPDGAGAGFSETVLRLPGGHVSYLPLIGGPAVKQRTGGQGIVLGSFNKLDKTTPEVLGTWAEIMGRCPGSRLVLRNRGLEDGSVAERILGILAAAGVAAERVRLQGWVPHEELLAGYAEIDIGLDPFPFSGGLTSCEALWSGVPVVTWAGDRMCGRQTASFLSRVGLDDLVAGTREEYIERVVDLAADGPRRAILRTELRGRMQDGPLCDARRLAEEFTAAVEEAYRRLAVL
ncbi:MAG: hypothetical protein CMJ65_06950 [Planctomycetaceae bacterium]|nr:hypothetical protein [Planctomycetaceae bacterium]